MPYIYDKVEGEMEGGKEMLDRWYGGDYHSSLILLK